MGNPLNMKRFFTNSREDLLVKICGIKNQAEAGAAIAGGADALGFNLYPGSKRFLELAREENWIRELPPEISRIAVLANPEIKEVLALLQTDTFDAIQIHGAESPDFFKKIPPDAKPLIKAFRVKNRGSLRDAALYPVFAFLLDSYREGSFGGTGESFDWSIAEKLSLSKPIVVAGGLTAGNVGAVVRLLRPYAVDVASGVEDSEGRKEETRIRQFVQAAKLAIKQVRTED
jgi:phosphoribosylanthranilate isomerase